MSNDLGQRGWFPIHEKALKNQERQRRQAGWSVMFFPAFSMMNAAISILSLSVSCPVDRDQTLCSISGCCFAESRKSLKNMDALLMAKPRFKNPRQFTHR